MQQQLKLKRPHSWPEHCHMRDILHSRVARSNVLLLTKMGAKVRVVAPPTLMPSREYLKSYGVEIFTDIKEGIKDCDIIAMLRLQKNVANSAFVTSARVL